MLQICKQVVTRFVVKPQYQDVFALLVPSCCDKSGTSCYHLVTRLMTVTDLLQVVPTSLILYYNLLRVCWPHQLCYKKVTTCSRLVNNWEQDVDISEVDRHLLLCVTLSESHHVIFLEEVRLRLDVDDIGYIHIIYSIYKVLFTFLI